MMRYFIFSYGSLAHKEVAKRTAEALSFRPAYLKGYSRNFSVCIDSCKFTAAGVTLSPGNRLLGMLVEVPLESLELFDRRESMYTRIQITTHELSLLDGADLQNGEYYLYIPKAPIDPTTEIPLVQSYIDVIVQAFLPYGDDILRELILSFSDLHHPWLNDRLTPRYKRFLAMAETQMIDELFSRHVSDCFTRRLEAEMEARVKPVLVEAIMKTIVFFDIFDFPLEIEEVENYIYGYHEPLHIRELRMTLEHLTSVGKLSFLKGYYVLSGRESIIETRKTHKFIAEKFWNRTKLYGQYMRAVPFVEMIAVCNSLSYDNPSEQSDIDLFIVIKPGRMWLTRFIITIILQFYGVRRHGNLVAGRFCLSFFVTNKKLDIGELALTPEDPYLAYWVKNLAPIFGEKTFESFKEANANWLADYGLSFNENQKRHMYVSERSRFKHFFEWVLSGWLGGLFEGILKRTLKKKTLKNMANLDSDSSVIVEDDMLKFHNHDRRKEYYDVWKSRL